jgi:hypothetical protein
MWRSSVALAALLALGPAHASAKICLPPVFEGGTRLTPKQEPHVLWLEPLLRQHEVCRRPRRSGERRIFVFGNSGIFGYPFIQEQSAIARVNRRFEARGVPARLFNLAMIWSYAPKDALIVHESLRFEPDVLVVSLTLDDFYHLAPFGLPALDAFFQDNRNAVDRFASEDPPGVAEPLRGYRSSWSDVPAARYRWRQFRQSGLLVRAGIRAIGEWIRALWFPRLRERPAPTEPAHTSYDCAAVQRKFRLFWRSWQDWSPLPYLAQLRAERGIGVLVVNWPVAHEPVGNCYNARYDEEALATYDRWLRERTAKLGLPLLDLHDLLPADAFVDSIHPTQDGQRRVAVRLSGALEELLHEIDSR